MLYYIYERKVNNSTAQRTITELTRHTMPNLTEIKTSNSSIKIVNQWFATKEKSIKYQKTISKAVKKRCSKDPDLFAVLLNGIKISKFITWDTSSIEYLVNQCDLKPFVSRDNKSLMFNVDFKHLDSLNQFLYAYYCSVLGIDCVENVAQAFFDNNKVHKFTVSTKSTVMDIGGVKTLGILLGYDSNTTDKYFIPFDKIQDDDGEFEYYINGNPVLLLTKRISEQDETAGYYYELIIKDSINTCNFRVSISLGKDIKDPELAQNLWTSGEIENNVSSGGFTAISFSKMLNHVFANNIFPQNGLWFGLSEGYEGDYVGNTTWKITIPEQFKELPVLDSYRNELTTLGNIDFVYLPKSCFDSVKFHMGDNIKDKTTSRLIMIVYGQNQYFRGAPMNTIVVDPNPMVIKESIANDPEFKDFVLEFEPFSERLTSAKALSNGDVSDATKLLNSIMGEFEESLDFNELPY